MALNSTQLAALKAAILADTDPAVIAARAIRNDNELARLYNLPSTFVVWRSSIQTSDIGRCTIGQAQGIYVAIDNMTALNQDRLRLFVQINPTSFVATADLDALLNGIFSGTLGGGGQPTRDALHALLRRFATKAENVQGVGGKSGAGSDASPGNLAWEGAITYADVGVAMNN